MFYFNMCLRTAITFSLFMLMTPQIMAKCSFVIGNNVVNSTATVLEEFSLPSNTTPGTKVGSFVLIPAGGKTKITCSSYGQYHRYDGGTSQVINGIPVFTTNIKGLGVAISTTVYGFYGTPQVRYVSHNPADIYASSPGAPTYDAFIPEYSLQFYVIGPMQSGDASLNPITVGEYVTENMAPLKLGTDQLEFATITISGNVKLRAFACTTPDITVDLGKHAAGDFVSIGATSTPVSFEFRINNCDPGINSVNYTFKPASGVTLVGTGNTQYLTLDSSSTASGVGVQLLKNDGITAVPFNTKIVAPNTGGPNGYNKTTGGSFSIPMKARYVRTGTIIAGTANSAAEFVMTYE
ncbi:type 1 fimbrial protein [Yokenella regensburgei]|uniref:fimbrial protein n=1 Tax=Yokenella regensburgei TaxID=158877 RepID=UPI003F18EE47